jgi:hypothetical protein
MSYCSTILLICGPAILVFYGAEDIEDTFCECLNLHMRGSKLRFIPRHHPLAALFDPRYSRLDSHEERSDQAARRHGSLDGCFAGYSVHPCLLAAERPWLAYSTRRSDWPRQDHAEGSHYGRHGELELDESIETCELMPRRLCGLVWSSSRSCPRASSTSANLHVRARCPSRKSTFLYFPRWALSYSWYSSFHLGAALMSLQSVCGSC